jgi:hypothetical protein
MLKSVVYLASAWWLISSHVLKPLHAKRRKEAAKSFDRCCITTLAAAYSGPFLACDAAPQVHPPQMAWNQGKTCQQLGKPQVTPKFLASLPRRAGNRYSLRQLLLSDAATTQFTGRRQATIRSVLYTHDNTPVREHSYIQLV